MPIPGISTKDFDELYTEDGFKKDKAGQPIRTDYSYFREMIGALIHELDRLELSIRNKEEQVVPGREHIDPSTFAEMRKEYLGVLKQIDKARSDSNKAILQRGLDRLSKIINESKVKLGLDKDFDRVNEISREVDNLVKIENRLQIAAEEYSAYWSEFKDDTVVDQIAPDVQAALIKERSKYYRPRLK